MLTVRRATFVYLRVISSWWGGRRGDCGRDEQQLAALTSVLLPRWSSSQPSLHDSGQDSGCALIFVFLRDLCVNTTEPSSSVNSSFVLVGMDQSQVPPLLRPPTVPSDATFPFNILAPTSPIEYRLYLSSVGTLLVPNYPCLSLSA
jgi:hypothetical protein